MYCSRRKSNQHPTPVQVTLQPLPQPLHMFTVPVQVLHVENTATHLNPIENTGPEAVLAQPTAAARNTHLYPPFDINEDNLSL